MFNTAKACANNIFGKRILKNYSEVLNDYLGHLKLLGNSRKCNYLENNMIHVLNDYVGHLNTF